MDHPVVSRAPQSTPAEYRARMGRRFKWVSSGESDFNLLGAPPR